MSKNLLLEIGTEEMPANIMSGVVDQLKALAASQFEAHRNAARPSKLHLMPMEIRPARPRDLPAASTSIHLNSSKKGNTHGRMSYMQARKSKRSFPSFSSLSSQV